MRMLVVSQPDSSAAAAQAAATKVSRVRSAGADGAAGEEADWNRSVMACCVRWNDESRWTLAGPPGPPQPHLRGGAVTRHDICHIEKHSFPQRKTHFSIATLAGSLWAARHRRTGGSRPDGVPAKCRSARADAMRHAFVVPRLENEMNARMISTRCRRVLTTPSAEIPGAGPVLAPLVETAILFDPGEMQMNLRPLHDRVIVKRIESETTTASAS